MWNEIVIVINNGICAYFIGEKQETPGNTFFPLSPHELSKLTLVFTKTTLVPLGTNTALGIENTKKAILFQGSLERRLATFLRKARIISSLQGELRKTIKKCTVLRNQIKSLRKVAFCFTPHMSEGDPDASWSCLHSYGLCLDWEASPIPLLRRGLEMWRSLLKQEGAAVGAAGRLAFRVLFHVLHFHSP